MKKNVFLFLCITTIACGMEEDQKVRLRNGTFAKKSEALNLFATLKQIRKEQPSAFFDFYFRCNNPAYAFLAEDSQQILKGFNFIDNNGKPDQSAKDILDSSFVGGPLFNKTVNPIANQKKKK